MNPEADVTADDYVSLEDARRIVVLDDVECGSCETLTKALPGC